MKHKIRTWSWVLSANFGEGLPYTIINVMLVAMLADMGCSNGTAALIPSLLALPWMLKFLWSPFIDTHSTKRRWMLLTQALMALLFLIVALTLHLSWWLSAVVVCSTLAAVASASYDVSCDGFYMLALPPSAQAFFVGIRSTAYRLGMLFASGLLILLAEGGTASAWRRTFLLAAALMALLAVLHRFLLPHAEGEGAAAEAACSGATAPSQRASFMAVVRSFFQLHRGRNLAFMLCFILFYRLGEAFLGKVTILFLKDDAANGGLALTNQQYGLTYGTFGMLALLAGGILGGICISRWGLRRCLVPMSLALNVPDLLYVWLAQLSAANCPLSTVLISSVVSVEQFGYGFGFTAFTVYLLQCAKGPYQTAHYAILTALMALGLMLPSALSGYVQQAMHSYTAYFILACLLTLPGIVMSLIWARKQFRLEVS